MLRSIRAVLFDAVGTLIYADPPVAEVYFQNGRRFGSRRSRDELERRFLAALSTHTGTDSTTDQASERRRWRSIVTEVFDDVADAGGDLFKTLWDHFAQSVHWAVYADVLPIWQTLEARGLILGIASNFDGRLLSICRDLEPLDRCQHVFYSAQIGFSKPSSQFYRIVQQQLQLSADQILMVGDHPVNDFAAGRHAAWHSILLDREGTKSGDRVIASLGELGPWLDLGH